MHLREALLDMEAAAPHVSIAARPFIHAVDLRLADSDAMVSDSNTTRDIHYLGVGGSALSAILAALQLGGVPTPGRILDFGSGAGRVTRWLKAAFPAAHLTCSDLRAEDVEFCRQVFGAEAWISGTDIESIDFRGPHDLIWMGSVLTHLDEHRSKRLVERAVEALAPKGLLVATTIGRAARAIQDAQPIFLEGAGWPIVKRGYDERGYGYVDYDGAAGYGLSLSSPSWVAQLASRQGGARLVVLSESAWDGTQDVFALQNEPAFRADPIVETERDRELASLRAQVLALRTSTSWRLTAPLRRLVTAARRA